MTNERSTANRRIRFEITNRSCGTAIDSRFVKYYRKPYAKTENRHEFDAGEAVVPRHGAGSGTF